MKKALLIIDVQNDYFKNGKYPLYKPEQALEKVKRLVECFRKQNLPIIYIQHVSSKQSGFFVPDTEGVKLHSEISPSGNEAVVIKHFPNSFQQTVLADELIKNEVTDLVICGMMTHMCVDTTVRAAKERGYNVTLIEDGCATRSLEHSGSTISADTVQKVYMASLNQQFAEVITCEEFLKQC